MGETMAILLAATGDRSVTTAHSGGSKITGIREMRIYSDSIGVQTESGL